MYINYSISFTLLRSTLYNRLAYNTYEYNIVIAYCNAVLDAIVTAEQTLHTPPQHIKSVICWTIDFGSDT